VAVGYDRCGLTRFAGRYGGVIDYNVLGREHGGHGAKNGEESLAVGYEDLDVLGGFRDFRGGAEKVRLGTE
jgi:hypothetical protein